MTLTDFMWTLLVIFFMVVYFMILFSVLTDLFRDHETNGWLKALWVLFLFVAPFLSLLIYLIARGNGMAGRAIAAQKEMQSQQLEYAKAVVGQGDAASVGSADQIAKAHDLLTSGAISQAEYDAIKAKALA